MAHPKPGPVGREVGRCAVIHYDTTAETAAFVHVAELDRMREGHGSYWNTLQQGFWILTRYEDVRGAYQRPDVFSNQSQDVLDPNPEEIIIPVNVDPPGHSTYRQILAPWFSPAGVRRISDRAHEICRETVARLRPRGSCDFVDDFAALFPTQVFLEFVGLPVEDAPMFLDWVHLFFDGHAGTDKALVTDAGRSIKGYFREVVEDRRHRPRDPRSDLMTFLLRSHFADRPLSETEILDICYGLFLGGLETTRAQMGYLMHHLATHPTHRARLIAEPELIPQAVEECLRVLSIVGGDGRKVTRDVDFAGCHMKAGDMVWLSVAAANRDPRRFPSADQFDIDREGNAHLGFAAGPHRCLGAHLARKEMTVMVEEWHRLIPDYHLSDDRQLLERGHNLALRSLPLSWE